MTDDLPKVRRPAPKEQSAPAVPEPRTWEEFLVRGTAAVRGEKPERGLEYLLHALQDAELAKSAPRRCCTLYVLGHVYHGRQQAESRLSPRSGGFSRNAWSGASSTST